MRDVCPIHPTRKTEHELDGAGMLAGLCDGFADFPPNCALLRKFQQEFEA